MNITVLIYKMTWFWNQIHAKMHKTKKTHVTPPCKVFIECLPMSLLGPEVDYIQEASAENTWWLRVLQWLPHLWHSNYISNFAWVLKTMTVSSHEGCQTQCMGHCSLCPLYKVLEGKRAFCVLQLCKPAHCMMRRGLWRCSKSQVPGCKSSWVLPEWTE